MPQATESLPLRNQIPWAEEGAAHGSLGWGILGVGVGCGAGADDFGQGLNSGA